METAEKIELDKSEYLQVVGLLTLAQMYYRRLTETQAALTDLLSKRGDKKEIIERVRDQTWNEDFDADKLLELIAFDNRTKGSSIKTK